MNSGVLMIFYSVVATPWAIAVCVEILVYFIPNNTKEKQKEDFKKKTHFKIQARDIRTPLTLMRSWKLKLGE